MPASLLSTAVPLASPVSPVVMAALSLAFACVFTLIIVVIEAALLTLLKWDGFSISLLASLAMNFASSLVVGVGLLLYQRASLYFLLASFFAMLLIETGILSLMRKNTLRKTFSVVFVANLATFLILILPSLYFGLVK